MDSEQQGGPFAEVSGTSTVTVSGDDAQRGFEDAEGDRVVLVEDSGPVSASVDDVSDIALTPVSLSEGKNMILGSVEESEASLDEKTVENGNEVQDADNVSDEIETRKKESDEKGQTFSRKEAVLLPEAEESPVSSPGEAKFTPEGDSVVDSMHVDVSGHGVAVVGDREEPVEENTELPGSVGSPGGVKLASEGDSVVDSIHVNVTGPGVVVIGKREEQGDGKTELPISVGGNNVSDEIEARTKGVGLDHLISEPSTEPTEEKLLLRDESSQEAVFDAVNGINSGVKSTDSIDTGESPDVENITKKQVVFESNVVSEALENCEPQEITELKDQYQVEVDEELELLDFMSEGDDDGMNLSHTRGESSFEQPERIDGQIVTDSEEEADSDDEGDGKRLFDSAALAALLKAATGAEPDGGSITITSQDGSRLFSVERPAGLSSSLRSLRPAPATRPSQNNLFGSSSLPVSGENEENLSQEDRKKLESLQKILVKFLRLVHRLSVSPDESVAAQVLYRLALLAGRQGTQTYSLDAAKRTAFQLEEDKTDALNFSINILVLGKSGLGKSATVNSIFGEEKSPIDAFETGTASVKQISGSVDGVNVRIIDTPGLKSSAMEQGFNRRVLSSIKNFTKKFPPDVVLYVDRLDVQNRDLNDLPLLKTITSVLGPTIWPSSIVTLTHAASAPPDGPSGTPLSYEAFVTQRSHIVQQCIGHAVGDFRMMSPGLMNPVSLVENHPSCRKNREGQKILPNGQSWRPQLLLLCYSMKILSEASSHSKPQESFDHRKFFGFRARAPPLPYMLSSMLQSRAHPKLPSDQGGDSVDSDIDLDDFSDSEVEEEDEYDQLPPFKPLKKSQMAKLSKEQRKAYCEEYDYRVKLLQKKQWKEELKRMREIKTTGKISANDLSPADEEGDAGAAAPVAVPLPDMALPPSFDCDNPSHRYRFLEPTSQFRARPVLDTHGWDHDCGYDGVNLEHSLAIANRFPGVYTVQITKDKKDFSFSLDSSIAAKHGESFSTMVGFDVQSLGKQLAYIMRGETKTNKWKNHKATGGISVTFLGDNVAPGLKVEDQISFGKRYVLVGAAGAVRSQHDTAYGANIEVQRREDDYPIGQVQSTFSLSAIKWKGDLALGLNALAQFSVGRNSKVAVRAGINNKLSGQVTVKTSSSEHVSLALAAIVPTAISIYRKFWSGWSEKYSIY